VLEITATAFAGSGVRTGSVHSIGATHANLNSFGTDKLCVLFTEASEDCFAVECVANKDDATIRPSSHGPTMGGSFGADFGRVGGFCHRSTLPATLSRVDSSQ
jgi:hypothetical protein